MYLRVWHKDVVWIVVQRVFLMLRAIPGLATVDKCLDVLDVTHNRMKSVFQSKFFRESKLAQNPQVTNLHISVLGVTERPIVMLVHPLHNVQTAVKWYYKQINLQTLRTVYVIHVQMEYGSLQVVFHLSRPVVIVPIHPTLDPSVQPLFAVNEEHPMQMALPVTVYHHLRKQGHLNHAIPMIVSLARLFPTQHP